MRKHVLVTHESLTKIAACFSDSDEVMTFINQMDDVIDELSFYVKLRDRTADENEYASILLKQVCVFAMFSREHVELIQQLLSCLEYRDLTDEEINQLKGE